MRSLEPLGAVFQRTDGYACDLCAPRTQQCGIPNSCERPTMTFMQNVIGTNRHVTRLCLSIGLFVCLSIFLRPRLPGLMAL